MSQHHRRSLREVHCDDCGAEVGEQCRGTMGSDRYHLARCATLDNKIRVESAVEKAISESKALLATKDAEIAKLRAELEDLKKRTGIVGFNAEDGHLPGAPLYRRAPVPQGCETCIGCPDCLTNERP